MLSDNDLKYLRRAIAANRCVLFLGSGFSVEATNGLGEGLPSGIGLARILFGWLGYGDAADYDGTSLDRLFDAARKTRGDKAVSELLRAHLSFRDYKAWYRDVSAFPWRRIYTTNVDHLIERVYKDAGDVKLDVINGIIHSYRDRPPFLESIQYIKLNGTLTDDTNSVTFGARQTMKRATQYDVWFDHFARDYALFPTVLVGTQLNEPLFLQALEARGGRERMAKERRFKSLLVAPKIPPVILDSLDAFNVHPVIASGAEFFSYLTETLAPIPTRVEVLANLNPAYAALMATKANASLEPAFGAFFGAFEGVEPRDKPADYRSLFLLGAAPTWDDIALSLDARLQTTTRLIETLDEAFEDRGTPRIVGLVGHRGSGKSTAVMRASVNAAAEGAPVMFTFGEDLPEPHLITKTLQELQQRIIVVIDDCEWVTPRVAELCHDIVKHNFDVVLVIGLRAPILSRLKERGVSDIEELWVSQLTEADIEELIDLLERNNRLGRMAGRPRSETHHEFAVRARKQLLVALREVTQGPDFDRIIKSEYDEIGDSELRTIYLAACLATAAGASLSRDQLIAISERSVSETLNAIETELRQLLVPFGAEADRWAARHPVIAATVVSEAPKSHLAEAYKRLLRVLAHDMEARARRGPAARWFRLYKRLVNHRDIFLRFHRNLPEAREIFDSLSDTLANDPHYWLQYGSLELEYGEHRFARHYIVSAESLAPHDNFIHNAKGHLLLLEAAFANDLASAERLRDEGREILRDLIDDWGSESPYPWHTLISHDLHWLTMWRRDIEQLRDELEELRRLASEACEAHPDSDMLKIARAKVDRNYFNTAV
jgi:hypothetical protein